MNDERFFLCIKELQNNSNSYLNLSINYMQYQQNVDIILQKYGLNRKSFDDELNKRKAK